MEYNAKFTTKQSVVILVVPVVLAILLICFLVSISQGYIEDGVFWKLDILAMILNFVIFVIALLLRLTYSIRKTVSTTARIGSHGQISIDYRFSNTKLKKIFFVAYGSIIMTTGILFGYLELQYAIYSKTSIATIDGDMMIYANEPEHKITVKYYFVSDKKQKILGEEIMYGWEMLQYKGGKETLLVEYLPEDLYHSRTSGGIYWLLSLLCLLIGFHLLYRSLFYSGDIFFGIL